jgi:hypothetical protein
MDSFYSCARCSQAAQSTEKVKEANRKCTLVRRGTAFADPSPCFTGTIVHPVIPSRFLSFPKIQANTRVTDKFYLPDPTISLFLVLDFRYDIPPPHPRILRGAYGHLPDRANLFE